MRYVVTTDRFGSPRGAVLTPDDLISCNIPALIEAGHLAEVAETEPKPSMTKKRPVQPDPEPAEEPDLQEDEDE